MAKITTDKVIARQVNSHQTYLRYAMEHFVKELDTIKASIVNSVMMDLKKNDPKLITPTTASEVRKMVDEKLSVLAKIDFED
jgi:hypothetical protein